MNTLNTELGTYKAEHFPSNIRREQTTVTRGTDMVTHKQEAKRITLKQKDDIIKLYKEGYNGVQIAEKIDVPAHTVNYHLYKFKYGKIKGADFKPSESKYFNRKQVPADTVRKMIEMWDTGEHTKTAIAKTFGISDVTVGKYLIAHDKFKAKEQRKAMKRQESPWINKKVEAVADIRKPIQTNIEDEIKKAEMRLEILKELRG